MNATRSPNKLILFLIISLLLITSLACITADSTFTITTTDDTSANVHIAYEQQLSDVYLREAKLANQELAADYQSIGESMPEKPFPESYAEIMEDSDDAPPDPNMTKTQQTANGYVAEVDYVIAQGQSAPAEGWTFDIGEKDEDSNLNYTFTLTTPDMQSDGDNMDLVELARHRHEWSDPKPPVLDPDPDSDSLSDPTYEDFLSLFSLFGGGSTSGGSGGSDSSEPDSNLNPELPVWYMMRLFMRTGLPVFTYEINMPAEITSHTINGQTAGTLSADKRTVTLVVDEQFIFTNGEASLDFVVTAQNNQCESQCKAHPNMIWDESAPGPGCTCICDIGYESDDNGDCVSCNQVCPAYDPKAIYDPDTTKANSCGCACTGKLMEFSWGSEDGSCTCVTGAEPKGNACACKAGYEPSADGSKCVEKSGSDQEDENCPEGTNCLQNPDQCTCASGQVCDPLDFGKYEPSGCTVKMAYIFISSEVSSYEYLWIVAKINSIRDFYKAKGYMTSTVYVNNEDDLVKYLGRPSTKAMAYFGHGIEPSLEYMNTSVLGPRVSSTLRAQYEALGIPRKDATTYSNNRTNLDMDYAYVHTCYSGDDMTLRDYLITPGGTYWGNKGLLSATQSLTEYKR